MCLRLEVNKIGYHPHAIRLLTWSISCLSGWRNVHTGVAPTHVVVLAVLISCLTTCRCVYFTPPSNVLIASRIARSRCCRAWSSGTKVALWTNRERMELEPVPEKNRLSSDRLLTCSKVYLSPNLVPNLRHQTATGVMNMLCCPRFKL